jgi:hypothetical protein
VGFFGTDELGFAVCRADIAAFTVAQVEDTTYLRGGHQQLTPPTP